MDTRMHPNAGLLEKIELPLHLGLTPGWALVVGRIERDRRGDRVVRCRLAAATPLIALDPPRILEEVCIPFERVTGCPYDLYEVDTKDLDVRFRPMCGEEGAWDVWIEATFAV